jgi:hypothetical protein
MVRVKNIMFTISKKTHAKQEKLIKKAKHVKELKE